LLFQIVLAILAFLAAFLTISPLDKTGRHFALWKYALLVAFVGGGVASVLNGVWQLGKTRLENEQLMGSTGYCFLIAYEPDGIYFPGPKWTLMAHNPNDGPLFDVRVIVFERPRFADSNSDWAEKWKGRMEASLGTLPAAASRETNLAVSPGSYQADIETRYDKFTETFEIYPNADEKAPHKWHVRYEVRHAPDGKLLRTIAY
jgi:hypothetical protein